MKTNDQVKHLFAHHQAGDSNNLHSDGTTLKSYSTPIAVWIENICFISSDGMTPTTASKHLSGLAGALRGSEYFSTPAFSYYDRTPPTAAKCIIAAAEEMQETFKTLCRSRAHMESRIERYETRRAQILKYADRFQVRDLPAMPEATRDLKARAKELAAKEKERRQEEARRQEERQRAQRIIDQGELDLWLQQGRGRFPYSFRKRGEDQITIKNGFTDPGHAMGMPTRNASPDTVVTSQGAEAPLAHVVKALEFYTSRRSAHAGFIPYRTNGHKIRLGAFTLDEIDEHGNVRAGCHTFTAAEIVRFRKQWGL